MNRRNFLKGAGVASLGLALPEQKVKIREVVFNPPSEPPAIYFMDGHVSVEKFVALINVAEDRRAPMEPATIRYGWGTFKLSRIRLLLSDTPQPNFEPITYWIPADHGIGDING